MVNLGQLRLYLMMDGPFPSISGCYCRSISFVLIRKVPSPLRITVLWQAPLRYDGVYRLCPPLDSCHSFLAVTKELEASEKLRLLSVPKWRKNSFSLAWLEFMLSWNDPTQLSCTFHHVKNQEEGIIQLYWQFDCKLPASRTARHQFIFLIRYPVHGILL